MNENINSLNNFLTPDSGWQCYLFGGTPEGSSIFWKPAKGKVPNFFWRWMQYLFFGNRWVKNIKE